MKLLFLALLSVFLYTLYIRYFKRIKQYERKEGLASHQSKTGTITMGGIIFVVLPLFFIFYDSKTLNIAITIFLYGLLGFIDDLLITVKHNNKGIPPAMKLFLQVLIAGLSFFLYLKSGMTTSVSLLGLNIDIKWIYGMLMLSLIHISEPTRP